MATFDGPPPAYEDVTASSSSANQNTTSSNTATNTSDNHLKVQNGIPPLSRRSMEDEARPLPYGWIRQYDPREHHQFFVDTNVEPPRSIWHHPYDDEQYVSSLSSTERARIQGLHRVPTNNDIIAAESDDEQGHDHDFPHELPPRATAQPQSGVSSFGRRMKDKLTNTTHEERERMRAERQRDEEEAYKRHQMYRVAMSRAMETGEPQFIGRDKEGKDVYIEPPAQGGYPGAGYAGGYAGRYGQNGYGYNPYAQGPYANPNARFLRPRDPYSRPYYGGYGGGLGMPIGLGLGGGLLAGSLLTGGLF